MMFDRGPLPGPVLPRSAKTGESDPSSRPLAPAPASLLPVQMPFSALGWVLITLTLPPDSLVAERLPQVPS